jgi:OOP family OmpA-OmpF porin
MDAKLILQPLVMAACLGAASYAAAQDSGFYIGAGVGQSQAKDACDAGSGVVLTSCDDKATAWRVFAGYQFNKYIAAEGAYEDWGKFEATGTVLGTSVNASLKAWGIDASAVGFLPLVDWFSLLGRVGGTYWDLKAEGAVPSLGGSASISDTGFSLHYGLGVQFLFAHQFGIRAEYTIYDSIGSDSTGKSDIHMYGASLFYRF